MGKRCLPSANTPIYTVVGLCLEFIWSLRLSKQDLMYLPNVFRIDRSSHSIISFIRLIYILSVCKLWFVFRSLRNDILSSLKVGHSVKKRISVSVIFLLNTNKNDELCVCTRECLPRDFLHPHDDELSLTVLTYSGGDAVSLRHQPPKINTSATLK